MNTMSTPLIPPGQVTAADLLRDTSAIRHDLGELLVKVEVMHSEHTARAAEMADHEARIRAIERQLPQALAGRLAALERWRWRTMGGMSVLAVLGGLAGSIVEWALFHLH